MSCTPGCCASFAEHVRSLNVAHPERRGWTKTVTDVHDRHTVDVTEHYTGDRQDVKVNVESPPSISATQLGATPDQVRKAFGLS